MTHETEEYNGWKNKPTWLLYTWLSNDYDSYHELQRAAADAVAQCADPVLELSEELKERTQGMTPEQAGLDADLMQWAAAAIDYQAVAAAFIREVKDAEPDPVSAGNLETLTIRIRPDVLQRLRALAYLKRQTSQREIIEAALEKYFSDHAADLKRALEMYNKRE